MFEDCIEIAVERYEATVKSLENHSRYPVEARYGEKWITADASHWVSGFFPGCLWYLYELTGAKKWRDFAEAWTANLESQKHNTGTHDLGFMMFCSFGHGYRLTENPAYKSIIFESADSLAVRYNPEVECIRSWGDTGDRKKYIVIIDNMMNLELLFWAAKNGEHKHLHDIAINHALKTMENQIRSDGSSVHIINYDINTGAVGMPDPDIVHGISQDSCWARGLGWALYGFTVTYRESCDIRFLQTAERIAEYFIANLPDEGIPFWDFHVVNTSDEQRDTSAASICASALLELSTHSEPEKRKRYFKCAERILKSLSMPPYLNRNTNSYALLQHAAYGHRDIDLRHPEGISLIFADYYFIEALSRYMKLGK